MRGSLIIVIAALLTCGCYRSYPLTDQDDTGVDTVVDTVVDTGHEELPDPYLDSDGDCISDMDERGLYGTDPFNRDTDGDGMTDLQEIEAGSDPLDPENGTDISIWVYLPYLDDAPERRTPTFSSRLEVADVYFLIDTTGSMSGAIDNVATSLRSVIVPAMRAEIADVQMGVGHFNDVPWGDYGETNDLPFWNVQDITNDDTRVQNALDSLRSGPWGSGWDGPEGNVIALWCAATGNAFTDCSSTVPSASCASGRTGYPCFRPDSQPIIIHVSDAPWHNDQLGGNPYDCTDMGYTHAMAALNAIGAKHIGVSVGGWDFEGLASMQQMSLDTGAVDSMGAPLVETSPSGDVSSTIVDMVASMAATTPMDVTAVARDEPDDPPGRDFDATAFIRSIRTMSGDPPAPEGFSHMDDTTFYEVNPGTRVTFDVSFYNDVVEPTTVTQSFQVWVVVMGDGVTRLDSWYFIVVVPPLECRA
jgi:hypothetical protein